MQKILFLFLCSFVGFSQGSTFGKDPITNLENFEKDKIHWGFFLGFNSLDFKFDYLSVTEDIQVKPTVGFNVGLISNVRLNDYFDIRFEPGLYLTQRNLTYPGISDPVDRLREVQSTYVFFPLLLKASATRTGNVRPYLIGGVSTAINLASNEKTPDDNYNDTFRMRKWTNFYEAGFGIDLYLEYFKFSPSIRGVFSFNDELIRDNNPNSPWTGNVQSMQTRGVFINFAFH